MSENMAQFKSSFVRAATANAVLLIGILGTPHVVFADSRIESLYSLLQSAIQGYKEAQSAVNSGMYRWVRAQESSTLTRY